MNLIKQIINLQKNINQPIYLICRFWCGEFCEIVKFSTEGKKDLEEMKKIFQEKYAWKENTFGITEQTYELIEIDLKTILNCFGKE